MGEHTQLPSLGYWDNTRNAEAYGAQGKLRAAEFTPAVIQVMTTWVMNLISTQNLFPLYLHECAAGSQLVVFWRKDKRFRVPPRRDSHGMWVDPEKEQV